MLKPWKKWSMWSFLTLTLLFLIVNCNRGNTGNFKPKYLPESTTAIIQSSHNKAAELTYDDIRQMVRDAIMLAGGFKGLIKDNSVVILKPNLVSLYDFTLPNWRGRILPVEVNGVTTDWRVTKAVAELVREYNPHGKIYVMEGTPGNTKEIMGYFKYTKENIPFVDEFLAIEDDSGQWQDSESSGLVKVKLPNGLLHKEYYLNKKYQEADTVISIGCLKSHWHAGVTGGIKNVSIGATPANIYGISSFDHTRLNMVNHESDDLHRWIHDFYLCRPVDFVIIDGLQGIQNGPTPSYEMSGTSELSQDQMNMRLILAGRDPVAVDTIESLIIGWDPLSINYLKYLNQSSAGNIDPSWIKIAGKPVESVRQYFEGVRPPAGGEQITDKTGPKLDVKKISLSKNTLHLSLSASKDTNSVRVYVDNQLQNPVIVKDYSDISLKVANIATGTHEIKISAYDRFLNPTVKSYHVTEGKVATSSRAKVKEGDYQAVQATKEPIIDGNGNDSCWENAEWRNINHLWLGQKPSQNDFSGRYKILWTPKKLFFLVEITDDVFADTHSNPLVDYYKDDCLEIFLDEDRSGGDHAYSYNAFAYHIALDGNVVDLTPSKYPRLFNDHLQVKRTSKDHVSVWEIALNVYNDDYQDG